MNKYALGTIVGTTLVALAKKHSGSQIKLKLKIEEYTEKRVSISFKRRDESYLPIVPEVEEIVKEYLSDKPNLKIHSIQAFSNVHGDEWTDEWLDIIISQKEYEEFDEEEEDPWLYYNWQPIYILSDILAENIDDEVHDVLEDGRFFVTERIVYNADTGEIYNPTQIMSKLRKK